MVLLAQLLLSCGRQKRRQNSFITFIAVNAPKDMNLETVLSRTLKAALFWPLVLCRIICIGGDCPYTLNNHMLVGHHFERLFQIDWLGCIEACNSNTQCYSYNFCKQRDLGICELNNCWTPETQSGRAPLLVYASGCFFQQLTKKYRDDVSICEKGSNDRNKALWIIATETPICVYTTRNENFVMPAAGNVINIKLTYSGDSTITCKRNERHCRGRWGCRCCPNCHQTTNDRLDIIITDHNSNVVFPSQTLPDEDGKFWYTLTNQSNHAKYLIFGNLSQPLTVRSGDLFIAWYSRHLLDRGPADQWETSSDGSVCFNVTVLYSKEEKHDPF